ncbi:MAG: ROK family transcriptional regulator [Spirochaetales bacterium]|uniref:ROK family transcriptional regulator n=1 Tax=Candidatus Thalassospirochaeta sargassi TaxID=3119039 RepID=A0AAJ1II74_9SPIO|nr:ROK family transcriptional regulator [Spirochaetales bacterium]
MKKPKNAVYMKQDNRKHILNIIHGKQISRADLARQTGLTRAAISGIVDDLINQGIVIETGVKDSANGRKPVKLGLNVEYLYALGVNIRYDRCIVGLSDINGSIIEEDVLDFSEIKNSDEGIRLIAASLRHIIENNINAQLILGLGISSPGPVDIYSGVILNPPKLEMWRGVHIVEKLKQEFDFPIFLDRDAVGAALMEKIYGKGRKYRNFIQIEITNNGIGCGIVINNKIYRGVDGLGGEFGHMSIDFNGKKCRCGNVGCIEGLASIEAVMKNLEETGLKADNWPDVVIKSKDDEVFVEVIRQEARYLGLGIVNVMNLFELEAVILSGEVVFEPYLLITELRQFINQRSITRDMKTIDVLVSEKDYNLHSVPSATTVLEKFFSGKLMEF